MSYHFNAMRLGLQVVETALRRTYNVASLTCSINTLEVTMESGLCGTMLTVNDTRPGGWFNAQIFISTATPWDLLPLLDVLADPEMCLGLLCEAVEELRREL